MHLRAHGLSIVFAALPGMFSLGPTKNVIYIELYTQFSWESNAEKEITKRATHSGAFHYFYACFVHATGSGALPFVYLKFYSSHSYF
jgi:hypothetical protein